MISANVFVDFHVSNSACQDWEGRAHLFTWMEMQAQARAQAPSISIDRTAFYIFISGPVHTYPDIFENGIFFSPNTATVHT